MTPRAILLGVHRPEWGHIRDITTTADNQAYVLHTEDESGTHRLIFQEEVVLEYGSYDNGCVPWALSYDGKKLAVTKPCRTNQGRRMAVSINGVSDESATLGVIHHLEWLDNNRIAFSGWNNDEPVRTFLNGEDRTGTLDFEPILLERHRGALVVEDHGERYVVSDDGLMTHLPPRINGQGLTDCDDIWQKHGVAPEKITDHETHRVRVAFQDDVGAEFDEIENRNGSPFVYAPGETKAGYIGIRYSRTAGMLSRWMRRSVEKAEEIEDRKGKAPLWAMPVAILFSPYGGPAYRFMENSRRYFPVDGTRVWKQGFVHASDPFFTPDGRLVVTVCQDQRSFSVAVDEDVGPRFDRVDNVRYLPDRSVCYLAVKENKIYRVILGLGGN